MLSCSRAPPFFLEKKVNGIFKITAYFMSNVNGIQQNVAMGHVSMFGILIALVSKRLSFLPQRGWKHILNWC